MASTARGKRKAVSAALASIEINLRRIRCRAGDGRLMLHHQTHPASKACRVGLSRDLGLPGDDPLVPIFDSRGVPIPLRERRSDSPVFVQSMSTFREDLAALAPAFSEFLSSSRWPNGVVVSGGAVVSALQRQPFRVVQRDADVDVFVHGPSHSARMRSFGEVLRALLEGRPDVGVRVKGRVATLRGSRGGGKLQVIYTGWKRPESVALDADMSYLQVLYDGTAVRATWPFLWSMRARETFVSGTLMADRVRERTAKASRKGFRVRSGALSPERDRTSHGIMDRKR